MASPFGMDTGTGDQTVQMGHKGRAIQGFGQGIHHFFGHSVAWPFQQFRFDQLAIPFMKMLRTSLMAEAEPAFSPARVMSIW